MDESMDIYFSRKGCLGWMNKWIDDSSPCSSSQADTCTALIRGLLAKSSKRLTCTVNSNSLFFFSHSVTPGIHCRLSVFFLTPRSIWPKTVPVITSWVQSGVLPPGLELGAQRSPVKVICFTFLQRFVSRPRLRPLPPDIYIYIYNLAKTHVLYSICENNCRVMLK